MANTTITNHFVWPAASSVSVAGPVLYFDPRCGQWSILLSCGAIINDRSISTDPTPVRYGGLVDELTALAHTLNDTYPDGEW